MLSGKNLQQQIYRALSIWFLGTSALMVSMVAPFIFGIGESALSAQNVIVSDQNTIIFSYNPTTVTQSAQVNTSGKTTLLATASAANVQYGPDKFYVGIELRGVGGGLIYSHNTGWQNLTDAYQDFSLTVTSTMTGAASWALVDSVALVLGGDDSEFWAGNYGPRVEFASLKLDGTELLSNTEFADGNTSWTSSVGWQTCHATAGNKPCASVVAPATTTTTTTSTTTTSTTTTTTTPAQAEEARRGEEARRSHEFETRCAAANHAFDDCPLWPGRSTTTTEVPTATSSTTTSVVPKTTVPETTVPTSTSVVPEITVPETTIPTATSVAPETTVPPRVSTSTNPPKEESETTEPSTVPDKPNEKPDESTEPEGETTKPEPATDGADDEEDSPKNPTPVKPEQLLTDLDTLSDDKKLKQVESAVESVTQDKDVTQLTQEDKAEIAAVVTTIIESGLSDETSQVLASNSAVLESITTTQAEQVFDAIQEESLTEQAAEAIVGAVQGAPTAIREAFEDVVSLFEGSFDDYIMLGQTIDVGQRRTVVAVNLVTTSITTAATLGRIGSPSSSGGPSSSSASRAPDANMAARKDDEENEPQGEIAGDGVKWIRHISIFKYVAGVRVLDKRNFSKKFLYGMMNLGFTLAGSLVVYLTLSGPIQVIAGISTIMAFAAAMWLHMKEPE